PASMLAFAHTVFGEQFTSDAVVTESLLTRQEWQSGAVWSKSITPRRLDDLTIPEIEELAARIDRSADDPEVITLEVLRQLHEGELPEGIASLDLVKTHP